MVKTNCWNSNWVHLFVHLFHMGVNVLIIHVSTVCSIFPKEHIRFSKIYECKTDSTEVRPCMQQGFWSNRSISPALQLSASSTCCIVTRLYCIRRQCCFKSMAGNIPPTTEPTGSLHLWKNYSGYFAAKIDSETRKSIYCTCYRQWYILTL